MVRCFMLSLSQVQHGSVFFVLYAIIFLQLCSVVEAEAEAIVFREFKKPRRLGRRKRHLKLLV